MTSKAQTKSKLTDAERHKRFVAMAHEVGASDDPKDFDKAFGKVVTQPSHPTRPPKVSRGIRSKV
jgi:hypothetical protein